MDIPDFFFKSSFKFTLNLETFTQVNFKIVLNNTVKSPVLLSPNILTFANIFSIQMPFNTLTLQQDDGLPHPPLPFRLSVPCEFIEITINHQRLMIGKARTCRSQVRGRRSDYNVFLLFFVAYSFWCLNITIMFI